MPTLYALRALTPNHFQMAKFDENFTVEATYTLERRGMGYSCDCPAGFRTKLKPCKHQRMMPFMMGAVNLPRFYDAETGNWHGLLEAAPGMQQEHEDGEATVPETAPKVQQGVMQPKPLGAQDPGDLPVDEDGLEAELVEDGDIPDDQAIEQDKEPAASPPAGQEVALSPTPMQPKPEAQRPTAPAASSNLVTRRI